MANIKSQKKRIRTNEIARQRNQAVRSALRTSVRTFNATLEGGDAEAIQTQLRATSRLFDKAVSKGVVHRNQAANKKSALAKAANKALAK